MIRLTLLTGFSLKEVFTFIKSGSFAANSNTFLIFYIQLTVSYRLKEWKFDNQLHKTHKEICSYRVDIFTRFESAYESI